MIGMFKAMLANVFENFRNMCLKTHELNPEKFLSPPRLAWKTVRRKTKVKTDFFFYIYMLLIVGKAVKGGICHSIYQYAKTNNKYTEDYDKD